VVQVKHAKLDVILPAEQCVIDGFPDYLRKDRNLMRNILGQVRSTPGEKQEKINSFVQHFSKAKTLSDWGLTISNDPVKF